MRNLLNKKLLLAGILILVLAGGGYFFFIKDDSPPPSSSAQTTSTAPSAQEDFSSGGDREPGNTLGENRGSAMLDDQKGAINSKPNPSQWTTSPSGEITIFSPAKNTLVKSGSELNGKSSLDNVQFRVIDSNTGVISMGQLKVVNGQFSASLQIKTSADKGIIEVFGIHKDGREFSNIEIPIKFR